MEQNAAITAFSASPSRCGGCRHLIAECRADHPDQRADLRLAPLGGPAGGSAPEVEK